MATTVSLKPNAVEISGSTSGTTTLQATAVAGTTTLTLPAATDTLVGKATTDTLTNKTLTGAAMNGTLGATTPSTVAATTISASSTATFAAGAAGTPSITTSGDTNTGIFFPAADTVAIATSGAEAARIDTSGNLLVGTSSINKLGSGAAGPGFQIATSGGAEIYLSTSATASGEFVGAINFGTTGTASAVKRGALIGSLLTATSSSVVSGNLVFYTNSAGTLAERACIDSSGQFYLGTAGANTPSSTITGTAWGFGSGSNNYWINAVNSTGTANHWSYVNGNGEVGKITTSGSATTYSTSSDYRLKNSISPMKGALEKIALLKPCTYKWNVDGSDGEGFIAHELAEVCPNAITGEKDATREEQYEVTPTVKDEQGIVVTKAIMGTRTVPAYQGVDTSFLVATLTAAIQEQQVLITQLTARITALEAR